MNDGTDKNSVRPLEDGMSVYKPASWLTKIEFIKHLILAGNNVLISVLGEQGGGKTTFGHLLQSNLESPIRSYFMTASALFDPSFFLSQLGALLNHEGEKSLVKFIVRSQENKTHTLIIIDDADYRPEGFLAEILGALQQQGQGGNCYFYVCLVSNYSLSSTLNKLSQHKYKDVVHSIELGHLSEKETKIYVQQRLASKSVYLTEERLKQFYQLTDGSIVGINTQLVGFFSKKGLAHNKASRINQLFQRFVMIGGAVLGALILALILRPEVSQIPHSDGLVTEVPQPLPLKESLAQLESRWASHIPVHHAGAIKQAIQPALLRRAELVTPHEEDNMSDDSMVVMDKVVVIPKIISMKTNQQTDTSAGQLAQARSQKSPQKMLKFKSDRMKASLDPTLFTIQLVASHDLAAIERFAQMNHIKTKTSVFRSQNQGVDWYVLTMGEYGQLNLANQAMSRLPKELTKFKPWIRLVSGLQAVG